ncbi:MAG: Bax inhibitor-1/YccA family protein [Planctomycetota bacterium]
MRSGNPALNAKTFENLSVPEDVSAERDVMTIQGTVNKTGILLVLVLLGASWTWKLFFGSATAPDVPPDMSLVMPWLVGGAIGGLIFGFVTVFNKAWAAITAPIYALLEGLFLGGLSAIMEAQFPGIVLQAIALTFGVTLCLLIAYTTRLIKPTENFKLGIVSATGGIFMVYLASIVLGLFGIHLPFIHDSGPIGIGFSIIVVIIAALNLVLDFDFIESGAEQGAPTFMEWYGAFGLMVTLIWLYVEILHLLAKLSRR